MTHTNTPSTPYAPAAAPVVESTAIHTTADGLIEGMVRFKVDGLPVSAYRAMPQDRTNVPIVLVVQEIFGLHAYIQDTCRRLAHAGYLAVAPDLFARQGDASQYDDVPTLMAKLVSQVPDAQVISDLDGTLAWAKVNGGDGSRVAITGFCWGGRITWLYCAQRALQAGVAWYGRLSGPTSAHALRHPVDVGASLQTPVLGLYGGQDAGIPMETVKAMQRVLAQGMTPAALASNIVVYPDAPHAFHADYRPGYRREAAMDGYQRMLDWFASKGVA